MALIEIHELPNDVLLERYSDLTSALDVVSDRLELKEVIKELELVKNEILKRMS